MLHNVWSWNWDHSLGINEILVKEQFAQFDETDETIKGVIGDAENNEDDEELILDKLHEDILNMDEEEKDRLSGAVRDALMRDLETMGREAGSDPAVWWEGVAEVLEAVDFSQCESEAPPVNASYKIPTSSFDFSWIRRTPKVLKNDLSPILE